MTQLWNVYQRGGRYRIGRDRWGWKEWVPDIDGGVYEVSDRFPALDYCDWLNEEIKKDHTGPSEWTLVRRTDANR